MFPRQQSGLVSRSIHLLATLGDAPPLLDRIVCSLAVNCFDKQTIITVLTINQLLSKKNLS